MKNFLNLFKNYSPFFLLTSFLKEIKRKIWREIVLGSYAQNYEDLIIEKYFPKNFKGTYLEIGAYHPTRLSNTYRFYKKGWRGVIVEPNPDVKEIFKKVRPEDKYLSVGVSNENGKLKYFKFLISALNTFSKTEAESNVKNGHKIDEIVEIEIKNISKIATRQFDFLSIDTEGFDELILNNWPWNKCRPKLICVEKNIKIVGYKKLARTKDNHLWVIVN